MADRTPLLASGQGSEPEQSRALKRARSECRLHEHKCFLAEGQKGITAANRREHDTVQRKLIIACALCFVFMIVEVVGGYLARSVAVMSDAAHMLSDVSAFLVSIFAAWAATQPSTRVYSYGYHRAEILGALASVLIIWLVTGALVYEAIQRTINPVAVDGRIMLIVSVAGICFNALVFLVLGVHGHLGGECSHDHGPGHSGCGGHAHGHGGGHARSHGDSGCAVNGHGGGHKHSHGDGGKHSHGDGGCAVNSHSGGHKHSHGDGHKHSHDDGGCAGTGHSGGHKHSHGDGHKHSHDDGGCAGTGHSGGHKHSHGAGCVGHSPGLGAHALESGDSHTHSESSDSEMPVDHGHGHHHEAGAAHGSCGHGHADGHAHSHAEAGTAAGPRGSSSRRTEQPGDVRICVAPVADGSCGVRGHLEGCQCIVERRGEREIEVRYEMPADVARRLVGEAHESRHSHGHSQAGSRGGGGGGGASANVNLRGALLHVLGDLLQSVGVALAGLLIWLNPGDPRWYLADPLCTFLFSVLVLATTSSILRDIVHTLMERAPQKMDMLDVNARIASVHGVADVHDLHLWEVSTGVPVLTAHVHIGEGADATKVLGQLEAYARSLGIDHSTIQICNPLVARSESSGGTSGGGSSHGG